MDLVEIIESRRFLGGEFLTWLWYRCDVDGGEFALPDGEAVIVEFDHADGGLRTGEKEMLRPPQLRPSGELPNVELAGPDKRWHKATAKIDGNMLVVRSADVREPRHVRYCYTNIPAPPFLYNAAGLPAAMFTSLPE